MLYGMSKRHFKIVLLIAYIMMSLSLRLRESKLLFAHKGTTNGMANFIRHQFRAYSSTTADSTEPSTHIFKTEFQSIMCDSHCTLIKCPTPQIFTFSDKIGSCQNSFAPLLNESIAASIRQENSLVGKDTDVDSWNTAPSAGRTFLCAERDVDAMQKELDFGTLKQSGKHSKINVFMGGRIALRRSIHAAVEHNATIPDLLSELEDVVDDLNEAATAAESLNRGSGGSESQNVVTDDFNNISVLPVGPILANALGAPCVPKGISGSISHKDSWAVAVALLVGNQVGGRSGHVGVDMEKCTNKAHEKLRRRLFSETEQASINGLNGLVSEEQEVLLRFSFKEAVYKAVNPYLQRYVEFREVEVFPRRDGTAQLVFHVKTGEQFDNKAEWVLFEGTYWITCVHVWKI